MGSLGAGKNTSGKGSGYRMGMSKEERNEWLDNAPVGTRINGMFYIDSDNEVIVEKVEGYKTVHGGIGAGSKIHEVYWTIGGYKSPYISRILRTAEEGTNKYYKFKK